jgi:AraC-like DNA-binding protein
MGPTVAVHLLWLLVKYASQQRYENGALQAATGLDIPAILARQRRLPAADFVKIWRAVCTAGGDSDFGLHYAGATCSQPSGDIVSVLILNSPTLGNALEKLARYHDLATDYVSLRLECQGEQAVLELAPVLKSLPFDRHLAEAMLATLAFRLQALSGGEASLLEARFAHPRPPDTAEHARLFGCRLRFDQPHNGLVMRRSDLELPVFLASQELAESLERFAQAALARLHAPDSFSEQAQRWITRRLMEGQRPILENLAAETALSVRAVQARLKAEGNTYRGLLDETRRQMALEYLKDPRLDGCDLAFLLGFAEQSAFNHAFKRWTGSTPQKARQQNSLD